MRLLLVMLTTCNLLLNASGPFKQPQASVVFNDMSVEYVFGQKVVFSAMIDTRASIADAVVLFAPEGDGIVQTERLKIAVDGRARSVHFIQNGLIKPFARVEYWYHLVMADGTPVDSAHSFFQYDDNRFPWQTLTGPDFRVNWMTGDPSFAQVALDAAETAFQALQRLIPVHERALTNIYIYPSLAELRDTLNLGGYPWTDGRGNPDLGVILVSVTPGDTRDNGMGQDISHQLAQIMLYNRTGPAYSNLPTWLQEGIAMQAEGDPRAHEAEVLGLAAKNNGLIPINALCGAFPVGASAADLGAAESGAFVRYLREKYGDIVIENVIQGYVDGLSCSAGARRTFGVPLEQLDLNWRRATFGQTNAATLKEFMPYLVLLALMLTVPAWRLFSPSKRGVHGRTKSK